jgi:hypothetical protein
MPTFLVTAPDGRKLRVTAPEGATQQDAIAYAQQQFSAEPAESGRDRLKRENPGEYDPSSKAWQDKYGPTSGMDAVQRFDAGAGKFLADSWRGIRQIGANVADSISPSKNLSGLVTGVDDSRSGRIQREVDEAAQRDAPLMATTAGKVGNVVGGAAFTAPAMLIPGAQGLAGAALTGAGIGAMQPVQTGGSRTANTLFGAGGGAAGYGASKLIGNLAGRVRPGGSSASSSATASATPGVASSGASVTGSVNLSARGGPSMGTVGPDPSAGLNQAMRRAMEAGDQLGFRTTPGQATGSRALQQMEARLESQPLTSGPFNTLKAGNATTMNRIFSRALGETSDVVDDATVGKFLARADKVYEDVADDVARQVDPNDFLGRLSQVENDYDGLVPGGITQHPLVQRLFSFAEKGQVTGKQAQQLRSQLGKAAQQQMSGQQGNRELGSALFDVQDIADDWLAQGLKGKRLDSLNAIRQQYRNFRLMTKSGAINPSTGNVSGAKFANTLQRADERGFLAGGNQSELYNAARFGQAFRPLVGDSGTATRMPQGMFELAASIPLNVAARAYASSPAVNMALRTQAASRAAGSAIRPAVQPLFKPLSYISPYALPGAGGLLGTYAAGQ